LIGPRELSTRSSLRRSREVRSLVLAALGGKCVRCGFADPRALQIDHVNGDGRAERGAPGARRESTIAYYKRVTLEAGNGRYQLLCANCNWIKRDENKEYGGRRKGLV